MISAENLSKRFGSFTAIEDVSFEIPRGEIAGFLGPNGSGKTTTLRILAGVFPPTAGRAVLAGHDLAREPMRARAALGYLPERVTPYPEMTVRAYLHYLAALKGLSRSAATKSVGAVLASCSLGGVADRGIGSLSKGFRQRIGIAQALLGDPPVLLLDEPLSGLDPEQAAELRRLLSSLRGQRTILLSSHVLPEIEALCDRVVVIAAGRIVAAGRPADLGRRVRPSARIVVEVIAAEADVVAAMRAVPGVATVSSAAVAADGGVRLVVSCAPGDDVREAIARTVAARGWGLRELRALPVSLEDAFLSLIGDAGGPPR